MNRSLVLVGCGIKFLSHLTIEAKTHIEKADKLLYLLNEPAMQLWIQKQNSSAESLDFLYEKYPLRKDCYHAISQYILENLQRYTDVCVALYGHPTMFAQPALEAVLLADQKGYETIILPGISAENCLFADLKINPATSGYQSFEATDFLIRQRIFDPHSHLILWQVGIIGVLNHPKIIQNERSAKILVNYLTNWYDKDHPAILYEAAQYPGLTPNVHYLTLATLPNAPFSSISTLYIPPINKKQINKIMMEALELLNL